MRRRAGATALAPSERGHAAARLLCVDAAAAPCWQNRAVVIRDATGADAGATVAIGGIGFARTHEHLLRTPATRAVVDQTYTREAVAHSIARCGFTDDAHFLVGKREGRVVGYLHYDCFASEPELHRIYLDQTEIGRGTGSRLMEELHARLGPDGSYIVMTAVANNTARQFYERHGLVELRRIPLWQRVLSSEYGCRLPARLAGRARGRDAPGTASGVAAFLPMAGEREDAFLAALALSGAGSHSGPFAALLPEAAGARRERSPCHRRRWLGGVVRPIRLVRPRSRRDSVTLIDLREQNEREQHGVIAASIRASAGCSGLGPIRQARRTTPSSVLACGSSSTMRSGSAVAPHRKLR